jgi:L-threonylcarbamoyladenylate synthase
VHSAPQILVANPSNIERVVSRLNKGDIAAIPTETVYGLAADASSQSAVEKIFKAKGRPADHPLIVHIASPLSSKNTWTPEDWLDSLSQWAREVPPPAIALAMSFWPGPLTMILPRAKGVLDAVTGGQETVGIRCPDHPLAQDVLQQFKGGLAAPSANRFGRISPTTAQHVEQEFSELDLLILDGGSCDVGIESTIVDLTHWDTVGPVILRPGKITAEQIAQCTQLSLGKNPAENIRFSGGLSAHYAPKTSLYLIDEKTPHDELAHLSGKIAWVAWEDSSSFQFKKNDVVVHSFEFPKDPIQASKILYQLLRDLDAQQYDALIFPILPTNSEWLGVRDRLGRAAVGSGIS